jgi:large subunit ribosomal protein L10
MTTRSEPRPDKVAVVSEIVGKLADAQATFITEYRGLSVANLASLRRSLAAHGGEFKVYKNTLARLAAVNAGKPGLDELLVGPSALTFVTGDIAATAKGLREFARANPLLVLKGGVLGTNVLDAKQLEALADLPPRDILLAQLAGAFQAPLVKTAGLLQALPRNMAYGLKALIDQQAA